MDSQALLLLAAIALTSFALSFFGAAVGLILGHLRLPLLVYYLPSTTAGMATNLLISGAGALTGALRHARAGRISPHLVALMGVPSVVGATLGALFLTRVDSAWARLVIGAFLLTSGVGLIRARAREGARSVTLGPLRVLFEVVVGLVIGFLAAVTGLMLGSLRLPMMIRYLKIDPQVAVGTNMAIGCVTALVGAATLCPRVGSLALFPLLVVIPPTVAGAYLGAYFTGRVRKEVLRRLVGLVIVLAGLGMAAEGAWKTLLS
jgi:uncharacterized membrane protein YfcA